MKTSAPLSKSQYGIYAECAQHQGEICYNITYQYVFDGSLDEAKLEAAVNATIAAHPALFTRIGVNNQGDPIQTVDDSETLSVKVEHITDYEAAKQGFVKPFDLYNDRLIRMRLLKDDQHFYWLIDIHHIIGDGTTLKVLVADVVAAYDGKVLEAEDRTMLDVACEEAERRQTPAFEEAKQWYAQNFDCGDCYSPLLPDQEGTEEKYNLLSRSMKTDTALAGCFLQGARHL